MFFQRLRVGAVDDLPGAGCFLRRTVGNQDKLAGLEGRLVLQNAVPGYAQESRLEVGHLQRNHGRTADRAQSYNSVMFQAASRQRAKCPTSQKQKTITMKTFFKTLRSRLPALGLAICTTSSSTCGSVLGRRAFLRLALPSNFRATSRRCQARMVYRIGTDT